MGKPLQVLGPLVCALHIHPTATAYPEACYQRIAMEAADDLMPCALHLKPICSSPNTKVHHIIWMTMLMMYTPTFNG
jgi:hypothetical protein